jgi:hypothetical protein
VKSNFEGAVKIETDDSINSDIHRKEENSRKNVWPVQEHDPVQSLFFGR